MSYNRPPLPPHHRQRRNDDNQRQIGVGRGNQMIPLFDNPPPPPPPTARRIVMIHRYNDVVSVLSDISYYFRQAMHIENGIGSVSQVIVTASQSLQQFSYPIGVGEIRHLSGWFLPIAMDIDGPDGFSSRPNGTLYVSLSGLPHGVSIANRLLAYGCIAVHVVFFCNPRSGVQPDAPGAQPAQIVIPSPSFT